VTSVVIDDDAFDAIVSAANCTGGVAGWSPALYGVNLSHGRIEATNAYTAATIDHDGVTGGPLLLPLEAIPAVGAALVGRSSVRVSWDGKVVSVPVGSEPWLFPILAYEYPDFDRVRFKPAMRLTVSRSDLFDRFAAAGKGKKVGKVRVPIHRDINRRDSILIGGLRLPTRIDLERDEREPIAGSVEPIVVDPVLAMRWVAAHDDDYVTMHATDAVLAVALSSEGRWSVLMPCRWTYEINLANGPL
jgi:hypothetical protein